MDGATLRRGEIRGRAALAAAMARFDPQLVRIRMLSVIDAGLTTLRFRGVADLQDGTNAEAFDLPRQA